MTVSQVETELLAKEVVKLQDRLTTLETIACRHQDKLNDYNYKLIK